MLAELYDPKSLNYRKFLSPEQFADLFGPTAEDYATVAAYARSNGLSVVSQHPNRMLLGVHGSVGAIEKAFEIHLQIYRHPRENRFFYAPDAEPSVPGAVPILDISGLDDFSPPRPHSRPIVPLAAASRAIPSYGSGSGGTYLGKDFRAAYAPGVSATGVGQSVGLLEFDGYYASDITAYENLAGLPKPTLTNVLLDGFNGSAGNNNIEVALDIELAIAMAPGLSQVVVYEAGPTGIPNDILNRMVTDNIAKQLSSSWTWSGPASSTTDQIFQQMAAQGQSFFQASGDSDAYSGAIPQPADSAYVTVVGGTTLNTTGPGGAWSSETTWNWSNSGTGTNGSSGGISTYNGIPTWQQGISMTANQGSTTMRNIPDVALTADNIWVTYNNGSSGPVGGTSCAAPLWAGFAALINQQAVANTNPPVGFLNPALYTLAKGAGYSGLFHDISTGNNTNSGSPTKFSAVIGYDLCTGWGTPSGSNLINALAGPTVAVIASNSYALVVESCTNSAIDPGETVTVSFGLANIGTANTANLVASLQANSGVLSPSGAQNYGVLIAGGAGVSRQFTFTANGTCGGLIQATLQLQDGGTSLGTVTFALRLGAPFNTSSFSQSFDSVAAPALPNGWSSAVSYGIQSPWVTTGSMFDTSPTSATAADAGAAGQTELVSPVVAVVSTSAQLTFRQNYNLAAHTSSRTHATTYYNGATLQIAIGGGGFMDIVAAGGSFISGGYNCTLASTTGNPLAGAQAWGGNSGGWTTTTVALPASAAGQNVQFKWVLGTGATSYTATGVFIDTISLQDVAYSCCSPSADLGINQSIAPNPAAVGQNLVYTLSISNSGPTGASSLVLTDALPANASFVSASSAGSLSGSSVTWNISSLAAGASTNLTLTVTPSSTGTVSNYVAVSSSTPDPNPGNNSSSSSVSAYLPPSISSQPTNEVVIQGANAGFNVTAAGSGPLAYQWTFGGTSLGGATTSSLAIANAQSSQAGNYAVVVSNPAGSITSAVANLTVLVPPAVISQPSNLTAVAGTTATFSTSASGSTPLRYQWMFGGSPLSGATASTLSLSNVQTNQGGAYCVVITNSAGSVTSQLATLTVLIPPSITGQPASQSVVINSNAVFNITAQGSAPLNYQWIFNGSALPGQTLSSLTVSNVQSSQAGPYTVVVTNNAGSVTSAVAQLTVLVPPQISSQPTNISVAAGASPSFQVLASGSAPLYYQWLYEGTNAVGANTNVLTITNAQSPQAGPYAVVITNSAGSITSVVASLTVLVPPSITGQPTSQSVVINSNAIFNITAQGAPLNYQWIFNGSALPGQTLSSLTVSNAQSSQAGPYTVVVTNSAGSVTSAVAQLTVLVPPQITSQPTNISVAAGASPSFQVVASGSAPLYYQWLFDGTNTVGANTNVLTIANVQSPQAGAYAVVITNSAGSITSLVASLTVGTPPAFSQQASSLTVNQGQSANFNVVVTGTAPLNYQWRLNGTQIGGATSSSYTIPSAQPANAGSYDVLVSNAYGTTNSSVAQLTVLVAPTITTQPSNQVASAGANILFSVAATGSGTLGYQWLFNATNSVGFNTNTLALTNAQPGQAGSYLVIVTNSVGAVTSALAQLTILLPPAITAQPQSLTLTAGSSGAFQAAATGSQPLYYSWVFDSTNSIGSNTNSLGITNAQPSQAGTYALVVSNSAGAVTSAVAVLTVGIPPSVTAQPASSSVIQGKPAIFNVTANGTSPLSYQWRFNAAPISSGTAAAYALSWCDTTNAGAYDVVVSNPYGAVTSAVAQLSVLVPPAISVQPTNVTVVVGASALFQVAATGTSPMGYQWLLNVTNALPVYSNSLALTSVQTNQGGTYCVVVTNAAGSVTSVVAQLTVLVPPMFVTQPTNLSVLPGASGNFSAMVSGTGPFKYQWLLNGAPISQATSNVISLSNVQPQLAGTYVLAVTNAAGSALSTGAVLKVLVQPVVNTPLVSSSQIGVPVLSVAGLSYRLEYKNNLDDAVWTALTSWTSGTGGILTLTDTNVAGASRFYRIVSQ